MHIKTGNIHTNKRGLKSKVNHLKRLEAKGQREILASQDFDHSRRSAYRACGCDILLWLFGIWAEPKTSSSLHHSFNDLTNGLYSMMTIDFHKFLLTIVDIKHIDIV